MRLDRNINTDGTGKYALLKLRNLQAAPDIVTDAIATLDRHGMIHWGNESEEEQFFVMKYKDRFTAPALKAYADAILEYQLQSGDPNPEQLDDYLRDIKHEARSAELLGKRVPD